MNFQININGTSPEELLAQWRQVMTAAQTLQDALGLAMPHGRDYQTLGPGADEALLADQAAVRRLISLARAIETAAEHAGIRVLDQTPERTR